MTHYINDIRNKFYIKKRVLKIIVISVIGSLKILGEVEVMRTENIPQIQGKLVYHTYTSYDAWDSKLYLFDFETKELSCINDFIEGTYHTMNACFNPNGTEIVFMGITNQREMEEWNIFRYTLATKELEQLTNELRNEDPKFSPDGDKIIYKQGQWDECSNQMIYSLCEMDLVTREIKKVTNDIVEKSMPYYSSDGKCVYYMEGVGSQSKICSIQLNDSSKIREIFYEPNTQPYYPIAYHDSLYFTKRYSASNTNDIIVKMNMSNHEITIPVFNGQFHNSSDPCPLSDNLLIISSTKEGGKGGYDLYIVDEITGESWSLTEYNSNINNQYEQLGASCYIQNINRS